jgi:hypothetical protein
MSNSQNHASPEQLAANRANAAKSSGPRSSEGKTRSAQNARKHGFAAAAYAVVRFEDAQEVANLKDDAVDFYQPVNSQEVFAVERIALTQLALLRAARLESGVFISCINQALNLTDDLALVEMDPNLSANIEVKREQNHNFLLAGGFQRIAAKSNALSLCLRYAAQAERQYRRAIDEFDRLKSLRPAPSGADLPVCVLPETAPEPLLGETNPILPETPQSEDLTASAPPQSEPPRSIFEGLPGGSGLEPRHPSGPFPPPACEN